MVLKVCGVTTPRCALGSASKLPAATGSGAASRWYDAKLWSRPVRPSAVTLGELRARGRVPGVLAAR